MLFAPARRCCCIVSPDNIVTRFQSPLPASARPEPITIGFFCVCVVHVLDLSLVFSRALARTASSDRRASATSTSDALPLMFACAIQLPSPSAKNRYTHMYDYCARARARCLNRIGLTVSVISRTRARLLFHALLRSNTLARAFAAISAMCVYACVHTRYTLVSARTRINKTHAHARTHIHARSHTRTIVHTHARTHATQNADAKNAGTHGSHECDDADDDAKAPNGSDVNTHDTHI